MLSSMCVCVCVTNDHSNVGNIIDISTDYETGNIIPVDLLTHHFSKIMFDHLSFYKIVITFYTSTQNL